MPRNANTGASIRALEDKPRGKCRRWKITVSLGRDPATGRYRQKSRNFSGTYTEAKAEGARMKGLAEEGKLVARRSYTFAEYGERWNDARLASGRYSEASVARDRRLLRAAGHILGQMRLQDVGPDQLEAAYARMRAGDTRSGKPASGTYLLNLHKRISSMYGHALDRGLVAENPCRKAIAPVADTPERRAVPAEQLHALVAALDASDALQFGVLAASQLGLRRGEVAGLSREDFDFDERVVRIRHAYTDVGPLKSTKNKSSMRELPLTDFMAKAAKKRIAAMAADFAAQGLTDLLAAEPAAGTTGAHATDAQAAIGNAGARAAGAQAAATAETDASNAAPAALDVAPDAPMVCTRRGVRMRPRRLSNWWGEKRASFGAEGVKLHELRHTFITAGIMSGVDIGTLQKLSGHATPNVLLGVYTHTAMQRKRAALEAMNLAS